MREITLSESQTINGGFFYLFEGSTLLNSLRNRAAGDGAIGSLTVSALTSIAFYAAGAAVATTFWAGAVVAPYAFLVCYAGSGAWNSLK